LKKYGLSALEKIKSRKDFEKIIIGGETTYSSDNRIRANYRLTTAPDKSRVMFAVAVGKKLGNAVWRNRVKRLVREAYRWNKVGLVEKCKIKNALLEIIFSPQALNQIKNSEDVKKVEKLVEILLSVKEVKIKSSILGKTLEIKTKRKKWVGGFFIFLLVLILSLTVDTRLVSAHAFLVRTDPADGR